MTLRQLITAGLLIASGAAPAQAPATPAPAGKTQIDVPAGMGKQRVDAFFTARDTLPSPPTALVTSNSIHWPVLAGPALASAAPTVAGALLQVRPPSVHPFETR